MQTFLPYPDFEKSAQVLDRQRLGKQRVECLQILRCLAGIKDGWRNHPAVKMWQGHEISLAQYGLIMCYEWKKRGYKDSTTEKIEQLEFSYFQCGCHMAPSWFGNKEFHLSHQSNLIRKLPLHYIPIFGTDVPNDLPYIWPGKTTI